MKLNINTDDYHNQPRLSGYLMAWMGEFGQQCNKKRRWHGLEGMAQNKEQILISKKQLYRQLLLLLLLLPEIYLGNFFWSKFICLLSWNCLSWNLNKLQSHCFCPWTIEQHAFKQAFNFCLPHLFLHKRTPTHLADGRTMIYFATCKSPPLDFFLAFFSFI